MQVKKLDNVTISLDDAVKCTYQGNVTEVLYMEHQNKESVILRMSGGLYLDKRSGEIKEIVHMVSRADDKNEIRKTMRRLRALINCNTADLQKCRWVTLTYAENMRDSKRLYKDTEKLIKKIRYKFGHFEYIHVAEPQGRGAWHLHCIWIFDKKAPYIDQHWLAGVWEHGINVTVKKLDDNDNLGAYLTAYLTDMEYNDYMRDVLCSQGYSVPEDIDFTSFISDNSDIPEKEIEIDGVLKKKRFVKGGRLHLYPPKFNLYRCSRGIKRPTEEYLLYENAQKKIGSGQPTFSSAIQLTDETTEFSNILIKEYYNSKRG